jgi:putrescine aminotransferase
MSSLEERNDEIKDLYMKHINPSLMRLVAFMGYDFIEDHAEGSHVFDIMGNDYIDCLGGFGVFALGHRHPKVVEAVKKQLDKMPLTSKELLVEPYARLAKKLSEISPGRLQYVFVCNSGTEAIEGALKLARLKTHKHGLIYTERSFHGKTMGSLSVTGREAFQLPFRPLIPGAKKVTFGDADELEAAIDDETAAFVVEPIQGEGGIHVPPDHYFPNVQKICRDKGILLIIDEVQTGMGRTGKMFACEHWGIEPDIMTLAKALGGGVMPIGAILGTPSVWEVFEENPLIHSSTFGGNPLACAAALAAIDAIENENLAEKAAITGVKIFDALKVMMNAHPGIIKDVRGRGCLIGVEFSDSDIGSLMISALAARKVLVAFTLNNHSVLRIEPALGINDDDIDRILHAIKESVVEVEAISEALSD